MSPLEKAVAAAQEATLDGRRIIIGEQYARQIVRAALEAIREPDDAMVEAACVGYWPMHWPKHMAEADRASISVHMRAALTAAIDQLLSSEQGK